MFLHAAIFQQQRMQSQPSLLGEVFNPAYLNARLSAMSQATTPVDKFRALASTLGMRFRTVGTSSTQAHFSIPIYTKYQAGLTSYRSPAGYSVNIPPVQFG